MKFWFSSKENKAEKAKSVKETSAATGAEQAPVSAPVGAGPRPGDTVTGSKPITLKHPIHLQPHNAPAATAPNADAKPTETPLAPRPQADPRVFYYKLMNALYDAVLIVDDNGHITDGNERVNHVLGRTKDDIWDMPISEILPAVNFQIFTRMKTGLDDDRRVMVTTRCKRPDGTTFPAEIGVGSIDLFGKSYVVTIRNIEKRTTPKTEAKPAVIRAFRPQKPQVAPNS